MDPSSLIFVAVFLAWAVYGVQKALEHHEAGAVSRTVDRFSHTMRVIARREPISRRKTRLVRPSGTPMDGSPVVAAAAPRPAPAPVRRSASAVAAKRRRVVLLTILVAALAVAGVAAAHVISWWWVAAPVAVMTAWLVACRLMVKRERRARVAVRRPAAPAPAVAPAPVAASDDTAEVPAIRDEEREQAAATAAGWLPVSAPLPTYVSKPAARRTVSTIDLDATGVWTSGRTDADAALAREADAARAAEQQAAEERRRATGA